VINNDEAAQNEIPAAAPVPAGLVPDLPFGVPGAERRREPRASAAMAGLSVGRPVERPAIADQSLA